MNSSISMFTVQDQKNKSYAKFELSKGRMEQHRSKLIQDQLVLDQANY